MMSSASTLPLHSAANIETYSIATQGIAAHVTPSRGATITSLRDLTSNREWLAKPAAENPKRPSYGARFADTKPHGLHDAFPTLEPCSVDGSDIMLPDHGECWSRPWRLTEADDQQIRTEIDGVALPYRFSRRVSVVDDHSIRLDYTVTVTGKTELSALWSAYPCFSTRPGTKLVLPQDVSTLLDVTSNSTSPALVDWPGPGIDQVRLLPPGSRHTFYVEPDVACSWAAVVDANGRWVRMSWNATEVPYLGFTLDAGDYAAEPVISLMPTTGFYGTSRRASQLGRAARIAPGATRRWSLTLAVGTGDPAM